MLRGLKPLALNTTPVDVRSLKGHALVHLARGAATGALALVIEHSDTSAGTYTSVGTIPFADGTVTTGPQAVAEVDVDGFKRFIRLGAATNGGTAVIVGQADGN